jgi:hypothetical protein
MAGLLPIHKRGSSVDMEPAWPMAPRTWENCKPAVLTLAENRWRYVGENSQANQPTDWPMACKAHKGQWEKNRNQKIILNLVNFLGR